MRDGCREPGSHEREIFEMMLRKDRFLAAMFALSLGACGGDAEKGDGILRNIRTVDSEDVTFSETAICQSCCRASNSGN